jgi:hypothetical protein
MRWHGCFALQEHWGIGRVFELEEQDAGQLSFRVVGFVEA